MKQRIHNKRRRSEWIVLITRIHCPDFSIGDFPLNYIILQIDLRTGGYTKKNPQKIVSPYEMFCKT
jgi:hypothetical protein